MLLFALISLVSMLIALIIHHKIKTHKSIEIIDTIKISIYTQAKTQLFLLSIISLPIITLLFLIKLFLIDLNLIFSVLYLITFIGIIFFYVINKKLFIFNLIDAKFNLLEYTSIRLMNTEAEADIDTIYSLHPEFSSLNWMKLSNFERKKYMILTLKTYLSTISSKYCYLLLIVDSFYDIFFTIGTLSLLQFNTTFNFTQILTFPFKLIAL